MKKLSTKFLASLVVSIFVVGISSAQIGFTNKTSRMNGNTFTGCTVAIIDWNNDGLDDIIRLNDGHEVVIDVQRVNNNYDRIVLGDFSPGNSGWAWGMAIADFDHNGYLDILAGGGTSAANPHRIMMTNNTGTGMTMVNLPNGVYFLQNVTLGDFNNDGWIDLFCCDDNAESHIYLNDATGSFVESFTLMDFDVTNTDDSGNYGSSWIDIENDGDLDLYIAKCRQSVTSPLDGRRINVLYLNNGNGTYTESAAAFNLNIGWQSWTSSFGDIDNDGDQDLMLTNHDHESQILENNGLGSFVDITASTGFDITDITPIESVMADLDNDGFLDIIATGSNSRVWRNNGNKTFSLVTGLFNSSRMLSFAVGDLNNDGFIDLYSSYGNIYTDPSNTPDAIWMNNTNANHYFVLDLEGTVSNHGAIGAKAIIYGAWGQQVREVRGGESYGNINSTKLFFGLGAATAIDSVVLNWPSGLTQTLYSPSIDQILAVKEGTCVAPQLQLTAIGPNGLILCTGQTMTISATAGLDYLWSDGTTASSITVSTPGDYNVVATELGNTCQAVSTVLHVSGPPDETPAITAAGETEICNGSQIDLTGPVGLTYYAWSDGVNILGNSQLFSATQSGSYTLTTQGLCQQFTSLPIDVLVRTVADPIAADQYIVGPASVTLTATGNNVNWLDAIGGTVLANGLSFVTPVLSSSTTYYVTNDETFGGGVFATGMDHFLGTSNYSGNTTNAKQYFDVAKNCTLKSVKVYTDTPGLRRIELRDSNNVLVQFLDVTLAIDSQVVNLNFNLTPGNNYYLTTDQTVNQAIPGWGNIAPRLKRSNTGVTYPYTIQDALSITNSSAGTGFYYYFYDWQVEKASLTCASNPVPVTVTVGTVGLQELNNSGIKVYPNPAHDQITIRSTSNEEMQVRIYDLTSRLMLSDTFVGNEFNVPVNSLAVGVYTLELIKDGKSVVTKIAIN